MRRTPAKQTLALIALAVSLASYMGCQGCALFTEEGEATYEVPAE